MRVVNYDELGPGYLSAYGVVAGYFVVPGQHRPSRLGQRRARARLVRLSVHLQRERVLARLPPTAESHRDPHVFVHPAAPVNMTVVGDKPMNFARQFLFKDNVYEIALASRGYYFVLEPPLPVNVLEGEIKGVSKDTWIMGCSSRIPPIPGPPPPAENSAEAKAAGG